MNITPFTIYLITRADIVIMCSIVLCFVIASVSILVTMYSLDIGDDIPKKFLKILAIAFAAFLSLAVLVPSKTDIAAMIVVPKIANSESVRELGGGIVELAKEWIEEMRPNKKEENR